MLYPLYLIPYTLYLIPYTVHISHTVMTAGYSAATGTLSADAGSVSVVGSAVNAIVALPLFVALWGASLFKSGNTGAGFAVSSTSQQSKEQE